MRLGYTALAKGEVGGLGRLDRQRLAEVLRTSKGAVSLKEASRALGFSSTAAAKLLSRWAKKGWLSRVRRGLYVPVPLESRTADVPLEDPWLIAEKLYSPCYIGGWSAAAHWGLTEQIFRAVVVMTTRRPRIRNPVLKGTPFLLKTVPEGVLFGLKPVWRGQVKVFVSDEARTILDMLDDPKVGGGIRSMADMFSSYLRLRSRDMNRIIDYAIRLGNGAVFKRLGYLLERYAPDEKESLKMCRAKMPTGNAQLDPAVRGKRLITRWRLWVPESWPREKPE
ncbi:MAG: type IV toxin-antitoxin system AbiEi family antitoxin domain-containing protein [Nitrospirae bacterium]|nr:type IV toxin-antitoxin system AbiEi family antitoxin domain-containing protein [Nitrospirota bacterium]